MYPHKNIDDCRTSREMELIISEI